MPSDMTEAIRAIDFQALIFDLDGVLVDSEHLFLEAFNSILAPHGVCISEDYFCQMVGHSSAKNLADITRDWDINLPVESSLPKLDKVYMNLVKARAVHARPRKAFEGLFDAVITGEHVDHRKPHPEPYEKLASLLDVSPTHCLVIEDSNSGIASAKAAGSTCIALRDVYNRCQDFSQADLVVHDLQELTISLGRVNTI